MCRCILDYSYFWRGLCECVRVIESFIQKFNMQCTIIRRQWVISCICLIIIFSFSEIYMTWCNKCLIAKRLALFLFLLSTGKIFSTIIWYFKIKYDIRCTAFLYCFFFNLMICTRSINRSSCRFLSNSEKCLFRFRCTSQMDLWRRSWNHNWARCNQLNSSLRAWFWWWWWKMRRK